MSTQRLMTPPSVRNAETSAAKGGCTSGVHMDLRDGMDSEHRVIVAVGTPHTALRTALRMSCLCKALSHGVPLELATWVSY